MRDKLQKEIRDYLLKEGFVFKWAITGWPPDLSNKPILILTDNDELVQTTKESRKSMRLFQTKKEAAVYADGLNKAADRTLGIYTFTTTEQIIPSLDDLL